MSADDNAPNQPAVATGTLMARAREAAGLDLPTLAAKTRIRIDHLKALEEGNLAGLPGRTYVFGFARSYARAVGMNEARLIEAIRCDYDGTVAEVEAPVTQAFSPGDPARAPSSRFAWIAGGVAMIAVAGGVAATHDWSGTAAQLPSLLPKEAPAAKQAAVAAHPAAAVTGGAVVFTAQTDKLWVKFYDASGMQLMQKQMAKGETYTVPADAKGPKIWTGRPDALTITVGGRAVAKLSDEDKKIKDVPVDAASLLARAGAAPVAPPAPSITQPQPAASTQQSPSQLPSQSPTAVVTHTPSAERHNPAQHQASRHHTTHNADTVPGSAGEIVHGAGDAAPAPAPAPAEAAPKPSPSLP